MRLGDLRGNVKAEPQATAPVTALSAIEGAKQRPPDPLGHLACIADGKGEGAVFGAGADVHGLPRRAMRNRVADQVRQELPHTRTIANDRAEFEAAPDLAAAGHLDLGDDLLEFLPQSRLGSSFDRDASAQPCPREVQQALDHRVHPRGAGAHLPEDLSGLLVERPPFQDSLACQDRGHRIAKIVAEHREEFFPDAAERPLGPQFAPLLRDIAAGVELCRDEVGKESERLQIFRARGSGSRPHRVPKNSPLRRTMGTEM